MIQLLSTTTNSAPHVHLQYSISFPSQPTDYNSLISHPSFVITIKAMLKEESNESGGGTWTRPCDTCRSTACTVYCEADARVHAANRVASRHKPVRVCDSCESVPAVFFCKADAASLCRACDAEIHSANPLARRHQRVPILPNSCSSMATVHADNNRMVVGEEDDEDEVASWLMLNPVKNSNEHNNGFLFGIEYLDLVDYDNKFEDQYSQYQRSFGGEDRVVPLQLEESTSHLQQNHHNFHLGINYGFSTGAHYNYNGSLKDLNHTVSVSSMDISVVPESTESDTTVQHQLSSGPPTQMVQQLTPADREARVLRYREKKKTRKFEKTIRYASRKAYAEIRPRIKGRFAKRIEIEADAEQLFSTSLVSDTTGYGIVPSF